MQHAAAVAALMTIALTTGCTAQPPKESRVTPTRARSAISDLVSATQHLFPGRRWSNVEDMIEEECALADGSRGADYGLTVDTTDRGPAQADIAAVRKLWTGRGLTVRTMPSAGADDQQIVATGHGIGSISFGFSSLNEQISAGSVCVAGSSDG